jgi:hypothetical protein
MNQKVKMVDSIFSQGSFKPGMIARLKVGGTSVPVVNTVASTPSKNLADTLKLSPEAQSRIADMRKLDAYLRTFSDALKIFNGTSFSSSFKPSLSKVEIEYVEMKKPIVNKKV